jgi:hypothetical protein
MSFPILSLLNRLLRRDRAEPLALGPGSAGGMPVSPAISGMSAAGLPSGATPISHRTRRLGHVPLYWAGANRKEGYLNLGDSLSPIMVAAVSGQNIAHARAKCGELRMAAVGTLGQDLAGGEIWLWGSGTSGHLYPNGLGNGRIPYRQPANTVLRVTATRGPFSRSVLGEGNAVSPPVYGDPVWLLPRFYRPQLRKKYELGVILHLSEIADRTYKARPKAHNRRYRIPLELRKSIRLMNTVTPISAAGIKGRIDEILSCKRIASTSLHGLLLAETYGIPCIYLGARGDEPGLMHALFAENPVVDTRFMDFYQGLGEARLTTYVQPRAQPTDWERVIRTIDEVWERKSLDEERLIDALPIEAAPILSAPDDGFFDLPLIRGLPL